MRGDRSILAAVEASKDPPTFMVLFEDSAALIGLAIAAEATALSLRFEAPWIDGAGSVLIGLVLAVVAVLLARESKALLIGEGASPRLSASIRRIALRQPGVRGVESVLTTQLSPDQVIATLSVEFDDRLRVPEVEQLIGRLEHELTKGASRPVPGVRSPDAVGRPAAHRRRGRGAVRRGGGRPDQRPFAGRGGMTLYRIGELEPRLAPGAWAAPSADLIGDVRLGARASVWFGAVLRGDNTPLILGEDTQLPGRCGRP